MSAAKLKAQLAENRRSDESAAKVVLLPASTGKIMLPADVDSESEQQAVQTSRQVGNAGLADAINNLNEDHFVSVEGGVTSVYREAFDHELNRARLDRMSVQAFKALHGNQTITLTDSDGNSRRVSLAEAWIRHPQRRTYPNGIALLPGDNAPAGVYNLWRGFGCEPNFSQPSDVSPALRHIRDVVCGGDTEACKYTLKWLAHGVQHPERQAEVAVVLVGGRGTGKGTLGRWFRDLFGVHGMHIQHARHLTGNFNSHLQTCLALFVDESFFVGDRAGNGVLKSMITEDQITVEKKGVDVFTVRNRLKIIMATNDEHAILAGQDERRYFVLRVSDAKKQDHAYFSSLEKWWSGGGKESFLGFLLNESHLSNFNIRKVPNTKELEQQKIQSLAPLDAWLYERLCAGSVREHDEYWVCSQPRDDIVRQVERYVRDRQLRYVKTSADSVGQALRRHLHIGDKRESSGERRRQWIFPSLSDARHQFATSLGLKFLEWDGDDQEDESDDDNQAA
jgi:hypothetical protein